jgi:EmrB/QacA subfamily drug resistance transporter
MNAVPAFGSDQGHPRRWAALGVLCLSLIVVTLDNTVLNTALPALARALHATTADLQWITDSYTLVFAAMLVTAGGVGSRIGQRRAITGGMLVFAAGSACAALSTSSSQLIGFRAVMGLGAAFVMPATLGMIAQLFPARERAKAIAIWSATAGVGVVLGPVLGGLLLVHFAWGSVFWINVPLIALSLTGVLTMVPALPGRRGGRLDLLGALLSAAGLTAAVDMIVEAPQRGWLSGTSLIEASAAVVLLAAFIGWQLHATHPMIDLRVFARRGFAVATASLGVTFFALFGALFVFSQYLQLVHGYSALRAGLGALPFALSMAATASTSNLVVGRLGMRNCVAVGLALMSVGLGVLSLTTVGTQFWVLATLLAVTGAGMGMVMAPASESTMAAVPREKASMASSINSVIRELGGVLGIAVVGSVVQAAYHSNMDASNPAASRDLTTAHAIAAHLPAGPGGQLVSAANQAFTTAMDSGMRICAAVALAGAVAALAGLPGLRKHVAEPPAAEQETPIAEPALAAV